MCVPTYQVHHCTWHVPASVFISCLLVIAVVHVRFCPPFLSVLACLPICAAYACVLVAGGSPKGREFKEIAVHDGGAERERHGIWGGFCRLRTAMGERGSGGVYRNLCDAWP